MTVTLPERTLRDLASLDTDRSRAIVQAVETASGHAFRQESPLVEVIAVASDAAILILTTSKRLDRVPGLQLVPVAHGRHLLTLEPGTSVAALEVALVDLLDGLRPDEAHERALVTALLEQIRSRRRANAIRKAEILLVNPLRRARGGRTRARSNTAARS